ncbi:MAG: tetratricopeptide repeat protein, partial [Comamonadaceae bacterium]
LLEQYVEVQTQRGSANARATDAGAAADEAYVLLARIAEDQKQYDQAVAYLGRIDDPALRYQSRLRQAGLRAEQGQVEAALKLIDQAGPQDEEERLTGVMARAQILRQADRLDDAVAELEKANRDVPDVVELKYELGMLYERQGKLKDFERELREVIALDPDHAHAYNALGYTLADNNTRLSEAHDLISRGLSLAPNDPFILDSMGWVKFRLGDNKAAIEYLRRAFSIRPEPDIAAHLGEVLWNSGQRDEAQKLFQQAAREFPDSKPLKEAARRLGVKL